MATWPATLPQSLLLPLGRKRQPGVLRSEMETGPAKQRARFTAAVRQYVSSIIVTQAQLSTFDTFYETTLGQGADAFTWQDPETDVSASLRFMGEPEVTMLRPNATASSRLYRITMELEKLP